MKDSPLKGNLIVKVNVVIPEYTETNLDKLRSLFEEIDQ